VGFLGFGQIAKGVVARLMGFGITDVIFRANPSATPDSHADDALAAKCGLRSLRRVDLIELACESDVLILLAPGVPSLHHVIDENFLRRMKPNAVLVNMARGFMVDTDALATALREKWIWAAGLDVAEGEPNIPADHALVKEPRYRHSLLVLSVAELSEDAYCCLMLGAQRLRREWR
jgi:glyoxylate/hydroxypyruvate reductase